MKRYRVTYLKWDFSAVEYAARHPRLKVKPRGIIKEYPTPHIERVEAELQGNEIEMKVLFAVVHILRGSCTLIHAYRDAFEDMPGAQFVSAEGSDPHRFAYFMLIIRAVKAPGKTTLATAMELFRTVLQKLEIAKWSAVPAPDVTQRTGWVIAGQKVSMGERLAQQYYQKETVRSRVTNNL